MSKQQIFEIIVGHILELLPELEGHTFHPEDQLKDLGANSLDRAEIVMMTMESLGLQIPRVEFANVKNIGELAEVFYAKATAV
ncbi:acyl carrier protein [Brevibacillus dissolubilis]|uniref:acyl carrier protein n=1 Tax=Brevibacillus dissolubilis TaxID=1844116 RepID=UPI0011171889|nr:acyl carrier protein [Brevibacillus dissolubilis]